MPRPRRLYWDTSVFLCFLNKSEAERRKICEDILRHAFAGDVEIVTSTFTIAEVIRPKPSAIPKARKLTPEEAAKIRAMFKWTFITPIELDERTAHFATDLAREYDLRPADSVHAASAILWGCDTLQAWDRDFSALINRIAVEAPSFITRQVSMEGFELPPIGPTPEDFEEQPAANTPDE